MEIRVKITPKSKKAAVSILPDGRYGVSVKSDRKEGAANSEMKKLVAEYFNVSEKCVSLISGHTSPTKTVRINLAV